MAFYGWQVSLKVVNTGRLGALSDNTFCSERHVTLVFFQDAPIDDIIIRPKTVRPKINILFP